ncbi:hypothetical protein ACQP00_32685 [Dactylosporangium sp. CS-047395]|uniref:hypothetical protein n=1 Tax=Dactylosporangium sp. CS-047395 TaxID=3239936 RepID=UPI003D910541
MRVFFNFANDTFRWVDVLRFPLPDPAPDDRAVLAFLIGHRLYGTGYAGGEPGGDPGRHGRYKRECITVESFEPVAADAAERWLRGWSVQWAPLAAAISEGLEREVYAPLRAAGRVFRLRELGDQAVHDAGWLLTEFHELVLLDRAAGALVLVVAAED